MDIYPKSTHTLHSNKNCEKYEQEKISNVLYHYAAVFIITDNIIL